MPLNKIEIRTEEIDEILGKTPNSIIRWGITVIFVIVVFLLIGSWFFKYPDFINSNIEITTTNPPAEIIAKTSGKLEYIFVTDNQYVSKGDILAVIQNPAQYNDIAKLISIMQQASTLVGKLLLPVQGSGKVKTGQKVNIKLLNYPYMEYGMVSGIISKISLVPNDSFYYVEVKFPSGLKTNYGKTLQFSQILQGSAEIITNDIRLLHRFLNPLKSIWKKRIE
ncbi:MAG: hypothetical protein B6D61_03800 [Bacteroidetes bacterium 4484_249]|nr:MAG: hypothetical protein B6D61_03800 [Bacteroidetes bacterium 4484_249]